MGCRRPPQAHERLILRTELSSGRWVRAVLSNLSLACRCSRRSGPANGRVLAYPSVGTTHRCRLRAAGVSDEDRCALLDHAAQTMSGHYARGDLGRLMREANLVLNRQETRTVLRTVAGRFCHRRRRPAKTMQPGHVDKRSHRGPTVAWRTWFCGAKSLIFGAAGRIRTHDPLVRSQFRAAPHRASCSSASINPCRVVQSSALAYLPKSYPASRSTDRPEATQESSPGLEVGVGAALEKQARDHESRASHPH
jgi:hypothetical protein